MGSSEAASNRAIAAGLTRREVIKLGAFAGAAVAVPGFLEACLSGSSTQSSVASITKLGFGDSKLGQINPFTKSSYAGYLVSKVVWPTLVFYDYAADKFVPGLAESWTTSADGLTWNFKLRPQAGWSDGMPVTAHDVVFTMDTAQGLGTINNISYFMLAFTSWSALDDHTVQIRLKTFDSSLLEKLLYIYVLPQHIWQPFSKDTASLSGATQNAPLVGSGPFYISKIDDDSAVVLSSNQHFYGSKPRTPSFGAQLFGSDEQALLALENGQVDLIPEVSSALKVSALPSSIQYVAPPALRTEVLWVNISRKQKNSWVLQPAARQALSLGINRAQIASSGHEGLAVPESTIVPVASKAWHDSSIAPDPFDPNKANQILDGLGFQRGSDGIRVANGQRMNLSLMVSNDLVKPPVPQIIQQGWKDLGIDVTLKALDDATTENLYQAQNFDVYLRDWFGSPSGTLSLTGLLSSLVNRGTGYDSSEYDAAYAAVTAAHTDVDRRTAMNQLQAVVARDRPIIPIVTLEFATVSRKGVSGLIPTAEGSPDPLDIAAWLSIAAPAR